MTKKSLEMLDRGEATPIPGSVPHPNVSVHYRSCIAQRAVVI
jgi:hypothetical protein